MFGNLQRIAARYIPQQTVQWYRFQSNEPDELGQKQSRYRDPIAIRGSWQAIDTQDVKEIGLDTAKVYRKFYTSHDIRHIQRGRSADFLVVAGRRYDVVGDADWYAQDGWLSIVCIEAGEYDG